MIDSQLYKNLNYSMIRICLFDGRLAYQLSTYVCLCLSVCRCLLQSVCLYSYVSMYLYVCQSRCLSVGLSVGCLSGGRFVCFSFSQSVCLHLFVCLFACLCLSRSVSQSVSLSVCLSVVGRSVVGLPQLSVSHGPHEACR